ncbi:MAG: hypothetical protein ACLQUT_10865 [Thermoleophilia bacterium]
MTPAAYQRAALPHYDEADEALPLRPVPQRRSRSLARPAQRALPRRLFVLVILLAILAAGRVTLSFAVVQKSLQTSAATSEVARLTADNTQLSNQLVALTATSHVRAMAVNKLHLVPVVDVQYLTAPAKVGTLGATGP